MPPNELYKATYEIFLKEELTSYFKLLHDRKMSKLLAKSLTKGLVLAGNDFYLENSLNFG